MRNKWILAAILLLLGAGLARAENGQEPKEAKGLSQKEISQGMSEVWCQKMVECAKDKSMGEKECQDVLFKSFKNGFDRLPKGQSLNLKRDTFEECKTSIAKGSCESLKASRTLPGCEFMSVLGQ